MANPAPTINQINAFNATQGTIIDFNIIGGTELVRSNRIYIYDLSDNSLICTHLYVSTESIHELPANTDSSIVYESGKSSADFVNGAQYYAQIQTYTDTAGTEGGSGLSVAKMFWCLVDPTLTITTIPSTISTTSYNISATYNANTSVVSNIIQQYQFNLYSATGSLLQSSGVVVGSGAQQGTSTAYDISYNFTGLSVGSSYYVVVDVTTTQGMSVSTQSNTFTVSIDTPTLGEATVVNNACDGYISVTSNLSGEYGGSASGEIASFVTDSVNDVSSLKVTLDPKQDLHGYDNPWVGGGGKNKLPPFSTNSKTQGGITFTQNADGTVTVNGTATETVVWREQFTFVGGRYIVSGGLSGYNFVGIQSSDSSYVARSVGSDSSAFDLTAGTYFKTVRIGNGETVTNAVFKPMLRLATESDPTYEPYENICPISGWDEVETVVSGVNVWDEEWEVGGINTSGQETTTSGYYRSKNYTAVLPNTTYYFKVPTTMSVMFYDSNKDFIEWTTANNAIVTTPSNCRYLRFRNTTANTWTPYNNDISINHPSTDHDYHAYQGHTYTTDLPQTVYGGTLDVVSGVLTVTHGYRVFDGSEVWKASTNADRYYLSLDATTFPYKWSSSPDAVSNQYAYYGSAPNSSSVPDGMFYLFRSSSTTTTIREIGVHDSTVGSLANLKARLGDNPLTVCYDLATPTTIQCDPQTVQTLIGDNNVWGGGTVSVTYNIPITNLLVKRQDIADVSGTWLTLYSQPITQASDMDFTFIDFLNQYGKTYKYALVPLLTQTQSGVEVEVEGGYTVSDEVQSIFDGVFIADSTGLQKCKANVGYGDVDMNQSVGTITPIGAKYPVVITNSKNQYHNGSISGTIVPDDYYFNGNLSRIDMVNKRNELEQFLTNKRAKIIKDWNSNIWLVMITENINCTFNNEYGMGLVNFNASWIEVGDPTNQQDLQAAGLIDVGGV